jgi:hypothetical protein
MLLRVRKPFDIGGRSVRPGDVIDLAGFDLPPGRAQLLVDHRFGEWAADNDSGMGTTIVCDACDRTFTTAHALSIHRGRVHRDNATEE